VTSVPAPAPAAAPAPSSDGSAPAHSDAFRLRRFINWFPLGLAYAFLYMGRYNLTVAKSAFLSNEDYGFVNGIGAMTYGFAFLLNGPLTDRVGGKRAMLTAVFGAGVMNLLLGFYLGHGDLSAPRLPLALLYAGNMYFQSFGAVAVIKVNSSWFHVRERGGFSGIFGTMISSGIFLAFTVNGWILKAAGQGAGAAQWVFFAPAMLLVAIGVIELVVLRDRPALAGHADFDTGDAIIADDGERVSVWAIMWRIVTNPIVLTIAMIEFCTGLLRRSVQDWLGPFTNDRLVLPGTHWLVYGRPVETMGLYIGIGAVAGVILFLAARRLRGRARGTLYSIGTLAFLAPFTLAGWGGILFVAGVIGGNVAGWISDLFFQSRRAPVAGALYLMMFVAAALMYFTLGTPTNEVAWAAPVKTGDALAPGDRVLSIAGTDVHSWPDVQHALACLPTECAGGATFDTKRCLCTSSPAAPFVGEISHGPIAATVERGGNKITLALADPVVKPLRAGEKRKLKAGPVSTRSPIWLGLIAFLMAVGVLGTHGVLSGTASMDFGGRKAAATATGIIDGFVYFGSATQAFALGALTSHSWSYWPIFMLPFAALGFFFTTRIWNARPRSGSAH
jgi:OPA family glycerol-3-phosphate transporter-like MFS transporter